MHNYQDLESPLTENNGDLALSQEAYTSALSFNLYLMLKKDLNK
jgi:hypothetical protein